LSSGPTTAINSGQRQFFYAFDFDKVVPADHLVRLAVPDLNWVHRELAPYYSRTGRPSIDPALMIRMLILATCLGSAQSGVSVARYR